jgi:hypothetical protein
MRRFWIYYFDPFVKDWAADLVLLHPRAVRDLLLDYESLGLMHPYEVEVVA